MYVDYYEAVAQAILSAKSDIYIEDWWLVREWQKSSCTVFLLTYTFFVK
jgi:hypothetical protein